MPVQFDEYEEHATEFDWRLTEGSNAYKILKFLLDHPDQGFTPTEIREATDIPKGSVGPTLQRLADRGLVRHKEPYWAVANDDRIAAYEGMLIGMRTMEERYEDEDWADVDWEDHAVDPDELEEWRRAQQE